MCAILGFIGASARSRADQELIWDMAFANTRRGPHAWGVAAVVGKGLSTFKEPGLVTQRKQAAGKRIAKSRAFAIHMRYATNGTPKVNENNHPHAFDGGALVHNGTVTNSADLADELRGYGYEQETECDSELIAICVEASAASRRIDRVNEAVGAAVDYSSGNQVWHSAVAVWSDMMVVVRAGKLLSWTIRSEGIYYASLPVDRNWKEVRLNSVMGVKFERGRNRFYNEDLIA